jgi:hypothetical protein
MAGPEAPLEVPGDPAPFLAGREKPDRCRRLGGRVLAPIPGEAWPRFRRGYPGEFHYGLVSAQ